MRVKIRNRYDDKYSINVNLPAEPLELYDMLDRIGSDNKYCNVYMNIDDECIPKAMCEGGFYDDLFKLNLLAQRLEQMSPAYTAGFKAVLMAHENYNLDDLILVTYGLEAYPIYPCRDHAELGEVVIDNNMISEVENCPDELVECLDKESIGRLAAKQFKGTFVGGYYCEVADYEPPDMEITISKPKRNEFQILAGTDENSAQWYSLPYSGEISDKDIYGFRFPLPYIEEIDDASRLNELAVKVAELDRADLIKLKALMELGEVEDISGTIDAIDSLSEFDFDPNQRNESEFGREYLLKILPQDFKAEIFDSLNMSDFGSRILDAKEGLVTSYGIISGYGQELYTPICTEQEQTENKTETEELGACLT
ncbi:hypothetical protein [Ruminococcus flavefaciens]|uniref:hypothetical protein n=1 Tax=Ruminococcus flavefaciens TaxID=1265 RepID=UPI0026E9ABB9|nr:hypothetical protein [Ruminococcus flavefaciens]